VYMFVISKEKSYIFVHFQMFKNMNKVDKVFNVVNVR
jgi:hypothetical protein